MNVLELEKELVKIKDKSKEVFYWVDVDWVELGMDEVLELDNRILLGGDFPPEKYEKDYKYERS